MADTSLSSRCCLTLVEEFERLKGEVNLVQKKFTLSWRL
jgi:hypothetical protein